MSTARIADLTPADAQYLIETVAPVAAATIDDEDGDGPRVTLLMPAAGLRRLGDLAEDSDGHLDEDSQVWIDGAVAGRIVGYR